MTEECNKRTGRLIMLLFLLFVLTILVPSNFVRADKTITVKEAIEKSNDNTQATVEGHVVGYVKSEQNVTRKDVSDDTNFAIAADLEETDTSKMLYVQIPKEYRTDFGLKSNPDMLDKSVEVTGNLKTYFRTNGLKDTANFTWPEEGPKYKTKEKDHDMYETGEKIQIHDIQGTGHESPLGGQNVNDVEGVVTYKYDIRGSNYLHIQSPEDDYDGDPRTSEGIIVYTGNEEDVEIGDFVRVSGTVNEYYIDGYNDKADTDLPVTQINARDDQSGSVDVLEQDAPLPDPIKITSSDIPDKVIGDSGFDDLDPESYAIDFWESMEGMRVEIDKSKAVAPQEHGRLVVVTDEFKTDTDNGGIRLAEAGPNTQTVQFKLYPSDVSSDFAVKTGDQLTEPITGVVNYGFSNYNVYADLEEVKNVFNEGDTEPEATNIGKDEDKLSIASYNVENFSANDKVNETPDEKAANIARAFVKDMESPDIVGVIEVQDNNGREKGPEDADASASYERLIDEIEGVNGPEYDYVNINPDYNKDGGEPDGNIRVGFLYNPDRVILADGEMGTSDETVGYEDDSLTLNPGRVAPRGDIFDGTRKPLAAQFEFNGESVVIVANHLHAQLGDDPEFGQNQPPSSASEEKRIEQAETINGFVQDIQADNPNENIIVLGDMNDVDFSSTLETLQGDELTNLIEKVPEEMRYSFVYHGSSRVIDHMLVSNHLAADAEIDMLHINSDFTEMHGRASDHDPVLMQLDLTADDDDSRGFSDAGTNMNWFLLIGVILVVLTGALLLVRRRIF